MVLWGPDLLITVGSTGSINRGLIINTRIIILLMGVIIAGVRAFSEGLVTNTGVTVLLIRVTIAGVRAF